MVKISQRDITEDFNLTWISFSNLGYDVLGELSYFTEITEAYLNMIYGVEVENDEEFEMFSRILAMVYTLLSMSRFIYRIFITNLGRGMREGIADIYDEKDAAKKGKAMMNEEMKTLGPQLELFLEMNVYLTESLFKKSYSYYEQIKNNFKNTHGKFIKETDELLESFGKFGKTIKSDMELTELEQMVLKDLEKRDKAAAKGSKWDDMMYK